MNTWKRIFALGIVTPLTLLAAACGGGGSDTGGPNLAGIEGSGFTAGTITGFGSIFVNGVEIQTNGATIRVDGATVTERELKIGQVVSVETRTSGSTRSAVSVSADNLVEGPVSAINAATQTLTVAGQLVRIDGGTTFDGVAFANIQVGDVLEVHGFFNAAREIVATRIERKPAGSSFEVTGVIAGLDSVARRFQLGSLVIDYGTAQLANLPGGAPANGQTVKVQGITITAAGVFVVTRVEFQSGFPTSAANAEVEGLITSVTSANDFQVGAQRVTTNASTVFENGTAANIVVNTKVEVEGAISGGVFAATKVSFRSGTNIRVTGPVDSVNTAAGSLVALGVAVQTNSSTRFDDQSNARLRPFNLAQVRVNDYVEIRGGASGNQLTAVTFERRDSQNRFELQAVAQGVVAPSFTLLGVTIQTTNATEFRDVNDAAITSAQFFSQAANRLVKVRSSTRSGTTQLTAERVELEN
jgi:hypothetical protein